jgi:hypothetical protein
MKDIAVRIKRVIFALVLMSGVTACTSDDDLKEIFIDREWKLTYINDGSVKRYTKNSIYSVKFFDGSFKVSMPGGASIDGKWRANAKTREFQCSGIRTGGNFTGDTLAQKMLQIFTNAKKYSGDTNWLQIKQNDNTYMQFYN